MQHNNEDFNSAKLSRGDFFPFKEFQQEGHPIVHLVGDQINCVRQFNQNVASGKIAFESVNCLCGSSDFKRLASYDRYSMRQSTVVCINCGLIQSNPRMTKEAYAEFYSSDTYRRCYDSSDYLDIYEQKYSLRTGKHIFDEIQKIKEIKPSLSVLEIGAGGGWNLLPFQKVGATVVGYDYSPSLVDSGRKHGIPMVQGSADNIQGEFDIIFLSHVWEHLLEPVEALRKIKKHLKQDGVIYIAVPNACKGLLFQFQNAHTYYFDPKTFHHYASDAGLRLMVFGAAQEVHMFGIFALGIDSNAPDLRGHYSNVAGMLGLIRVKRWIKVFLRSLHLIK